MSRVGKLLSKWNDYRRLGESLVDEGVPFDAASAAIDERAREREELEEWQRRRAASTAEIESSCKRYGWWWPR